jgi:hypothetical protein
MNMFDDSHYRSFDPQPITTFMAWVQQADVPLKFAYAWQESIYAALRCFKKGRPVRDLRKAASMMEMIADMIEQDDTDAQMDLMTNWDSTDAPPDGWIDYVETPGSVEAGSFHYHEFIDDIGKLRGDEGVMSFEELGNTLDEKKKAEMRAKTREDMLNIEPISDEEKAMLFDKWNADRTEVES